MRLPKPGEVYERWDGEAVLVAGITLDDMGTLCVEVETRDAPSAMLGMGEWLGVAREANTYPPPRRFVFLEGSADALPETTTRFTDDPTEPSRSAKQAVLESALGHENNQGPLTVVPESSNE